MADDAAILAGLATGELHRFADWPIAKIPNGPGVYTVWRGKDLMYVGVAGRGRSAEESLVATSGLRGRLASHASGRRSGDQFCVYVCDRLVLSEVREKIDDVVAGKLSLDQLTRDLIRRELTFRVASTSDYRTALRIEDEIKRHGLSATGRPFLNPGPSRG